MSLGVTVGKFYPFHRGHEHLINQAAAQVDKLVVLLCWKPDQELPGPLRASWIRECCPQVEVIEVLDDLPDASEPWARRTIEVLGGPPDVAFTSEEYGETYAALMGCRHICIDRDRATFPISGSELREELSSHWQHLTPPARAHLARRVCVLGVESSGTTTLAQDLARHFETVWVPEHGRWYWEGRRWTPNQESWETAEFHRIARGQIALEEDLARQANRLVVADTDPLATYVWHRRFMGHDDEALWELATSRRYDLYLLTEPDFPFVQDGTREGEAIRAAMHGWFVEALEGAGRRYLRIGGGRCGRTTAAVEQVEPLLEFAPLRQP